MINEAYPSYIDIAILNVIRIQTLILYHEREITYINE